MGERSRSRSDVSRAVSIAEARFRKKKADWILRRAYVCIIHLLHSYGYIIGIIICIIVIAIRAWEEKGRVYDLHHHRPVRCIYATASFYIWFCGIRVKKEKNMNGANGPLPVVTL